MSVDPTQDFVTPGTNLTVEGVPPIPNTLAVTLRRYTEFRAALFADWHPTRREMLIRTRFADTAQVHSVAFPGGDRHQMTFFADTVGAASYEPTDGTYFVFSKDTGGNEFSQNYRYDLEEGTITLLTDGASKNSHGRWSNAGDQMVYSSTQRTGKDVDLYCIHPADPSSDRLLSALEGGGWFALDWSPDDSQILAAEYVSINESYLWLFDAQSGEMSLLTPKGGPKVSYKEAKFAADGKSLYVVTDRDNEFAHLALFDLTTGAETILTQTLNWGVEEFDLSPDGSQIAFVTNEDGISVLRLFETETGQITVPSGIPIGIIGGLQWHANSQDLAFGLVSAHAPSDVYSLNLKTHEVSRWTRSETGGLNAERFSEPELVRWESFDGKLISGFLSRPQPQFTGKRPVIIVIHGGPESQARPGFIGQSNYYLNELGVALIYPNVRGSSGYGKTFLDSDNGFKREDTYKDIGALLDWIAAQPELDAKRIMVSGGSYGGHMTLAVATLYSDKIACSVDIVGMSNLVTFLENTEGYRRDLRRVEYGDERDPEMRAFLERIAPLNHAEKIQKPLFIIQGKNDPRVPASEALQMTETVRQNNIPVWFLMADDEGHGFAKKKNIEFQFCATVQFVQAFLLETSNNT
ncbi:MAG: prolyl oligopeptidase family serine peptidase [Janthinobacterium lividum]